MLGLTTKHIYFADSRKRFRIRYNRMVAFDPYDDGFGIVRDAPDGETPDAPDQGRLGRLQPGADLN